MQIAHSGHRQSLPLRGLIRKSRVNWFGLLLLFKSYSIKADLAKKPYVDDHSKSETVSLEN